MDDENLIEKLTLREKIRLLSGGDAWHMAPIPRLGIEAIRTSDGPNGVRGTRILAPVPGAVFPCGTALASTWNTELLEEVGKGLADECYAKGAHVILGPTCNIQRSPLGGRGFESYSEDPLLSGKIAAAWINGVQSRNIGATIKHFVCNDQETRRMSVNAEVEETPLREIYLKPFEIAWRDSKPWAFMTAYNRVDGPAASENVTLLKSILRDEWGFGNRLIMSDWFGTYSIAPPIHAGLTLEMPGRTVVRGPALERAINAGQVSLEEVDERTSEVLDLYARTRASRIPERAPEGQNNTPEQRARLRHAATESVVLLKNDKHLLPLSPDIQKLAVIGPLARTAVINGGGSASLMPYYAVSPEQGIRGAISEKTQIDHHVGTYAHKLLPIDLFLGNLKTPSGDPGILVEFFNEPLDHLSPVVFSITLPMTLLLFIDSIPSSVKMTCYARCRATFTSPRTAAYDFGLTVAGQADLYVDGTLTIDNSTHQKRGDLFFGAATVEERATVYLEKGRAYNIEIRFGNAKQLPGGDVGLPPLFERGGVRLGIAEVMDTQKGLQEAVEVAKRNEAAVLCVGLSGEWESEGFDRPDMKLPLATDELVERALEAQPNTIVVVQSGTPVELPWIDKASAVVYAGFGGCEAGNAIADILFGRENATGRLSLTWPRKLEDSPSYGNFPGEGNEVHYREGLGVGYRSRTSPQPLFPFGHGLSLPSFPTVIFRSADIISLTSTPANFFATVSVCLKLAEGGKRGEGKETKQVVALYVQHPKEGRLQRDRKDRPVKELKAFTKATFPATATRTGAGEVTVELKLEAVDLARWESAHKDHSEARGATQGTEAMGGRKGRWVLEKGIYVVTIGAGRADDEKLKLELVVEHEVSWRGLGPGLHEPKE